jgi:hypothetical protein
MPGTVNFFVDFHITGGGNGYLPPGSERNRNLLQINQLNRMSGEPEEFLNRTDQLLRG